MPTLTETYPALRPLTADELKALTPERAATLLSEVQKAGQQINNNVVQLETQHAALGEQIDGLVAQAKTEFGVETLEEMETLEADALARVQETFGKLAAIELEA